MTKSYLPKLLLIILTMYLIWMVMDSRTDLPERIATHFNFSGQPDGWQNQSTFILISCFLFAALAGMFLFIAWVITVSPPELLNMPNKKYWLSAERKPNTLNLLRTYILWFAVFVQAFLGYIMHSIIMFNSLSSQQTNLPITKPLIIFGTGTMIWLILMFRQFRNPEKSV